MAYQGITTSPIGSADSLLDGAVKINSNFTEIYNAFGNVSNNISERVTVAGGTSNERQYELIKPDLGTIIINGSKIGLRANFDSGYGRSLYYQPTGTIGRLNTRGFLTQAGDHVTIFNDPNQTAILPGSTILIQLPTNPIFGNKVTIIKPITNYNVEVTTVGVSNADIIASDFALNGNDKRIMAVQENMLLDLPGPINTYTFTFVGNAYQSDVNPIAPTASIGQAIGWSMQAS